MRNARKELKATLRRGSARLELLSADQHYFYTMQREVFVRKFKPVNCSRNIAIKLTVIPVTSSHEFWPGNDYIIRDWMRYINRIEFEDYEDDIREYEKLLGEIEEVVFVNHPRLGLVVKG